MKGVNIVQVIEKLSKELLIPMWGKIPVKMALASKTIAIVEWALRMYEDDILKEKDIDEVFEHVKHIASINGVEDINYNYDNLVEFFIENTKVRSDDTYMKYLKRVGVLCIAFLTILYLTTGSKTPFELIAEIEEGEEHV